MSKLLDKRVFKVEKNDQRFGRFIKKPTSVFYTVMDYLALYHAGYHRAGTRLEVKLEIPEFLINDLRYVNDTMNIIQNELKEFIEIFGSDTKLTTSKTVLESELIVTINKI